MGWSYERLGPAVYRWRSPHGYEFVTGPDGTVDISPDTDIGAAQGEWSPFGYVTDPRNTHAA